MASNPPPPAERASELINKLPSSPNLVTKTGSVILGTGLVAAAISQELYVVNEETVIAVGFVVLASFIAKVRSRCPFMSSRLVCAARCLNRLLFSSCRASASRTATGPRATCRRSRTC